MFRKQKADFKWVFAGAAHSAKKTFAEIFPKEGPLSDSL